VEVVVPGAQTEATFQLSSELDPSQNDGDDTYAAIVMESSADLLYCVYNGGMG